MKKTNNTARFPVKILVPEITTDYDFNTEQYTRNDFTWNEKQVHRANDKQEFLNAPVCYNDFMTFFSNAEKYKEIFGMDIIRENVKMFTMRDIVNIEKVTDQVGVIMASQGNGILLGELQTMKFTEYKGSWEREVTNHGYEIAVSSKYSSVYESKFLKACLYDKFPYLKDFQVEVYSLDQTNPEFYLKTENGSVYVPIKALIERNRNLVIARMQTYFNLYYNSRPELRTKALEALEDKETLRFFNALENPECFEPIHASNEPEYEIQERYGRYKYLLIVSGENYILTPVVYDTYTKAIEAMEEEIIRLTENGGSYDTDLQVKTGEATGYAVTAKNDTYNFRVYRMKI